MKKILGKGMSGGGFSLMELLIVISCIAILGAIAVSTLVINHP